MKRFCYVVLAIVFSLFLFSAANAEMIPAGTYTVGEDIPAGSYSISCAGNDQVMFDLWGRAVKDHSSNGGNLFQVWVKPGENGSIGKITVEEGNQVEIVHGALNFEKYSGLTSDTIPSGVYTVGEDIPAGSYTVSCAGNDQVMLDLWGRAVKDHSSNGGNLFQVWVKPEENGRIGKITIEEGNQVEIVDGALNFEKYSGLTSDITPSGVYTVGEDIPAGSYTVSCVENKEVLFHLWGKSAGDTSSNGGSIYQVWIKPGENGRIGKISIEEGNVVEIIHGSVNFVEYIRKVLSAGQTERGFSH